jgi:hypothetical protein
MIGKKRSRCFGIAPRDAAAFSGSPQFRQVLDCGGPPPLFTPATEISAMAQIAQRENKIPIAGRLVDPTQQPVFPFRARSENQVSPVIIGESQPSIDHPSSRAPIASPVSNSGTSSAWTWLMTIDLKFSYSQDFDDSLFFQRLTLIDICCGPPAGR